MVKTPENAHADGRRVRSERSREAIKKAMIDLMADGIREPTAQLVSERAGVGIRTVFRQFDDMGSLFHSLHQDLINRDSPILQTSLTEGTKEERLDSAIEARHKLYTINRETLLSTYGLMWKYDALKQNYADLNHRLKKRMLLSLYELKTAPEADKNLAEMLLSFETWNRLIRHQGLSPDDAKAIIRSQVLPLLKP